MSNRKRRSSTGSRVSTLGLALVLLTLIGLAIGPSVGLAQSQSEVGGTVVVEEGETVDSLEAVGGNVLVEGTVSGDVSAAGGNIYITGDVGGDVSTAGGNIELAGDVAGDVSTAGGNVELAETGTISGSLEGAAGTATIDGEVGGDVQLGADTIVLGETAAIAGDLEYGGTLEGNTDAVAGTITEDSSLVDIGPTIQPIGSWLVAIYAFVFNLLLGAILLALFPNFSGQVVDRVRAEPVRTGLVGFGVLIGVPAILVAVAITIIGIPITLVGSVLFALVVWIGLIYGRFALGAWLLSLVDRENQWAALLIGLFIGALLTQIPFVGGLADLLLVVLGLGALGTGLYLGARRSREESTPAAGPAAE